MFPPHSPTLPFARDAVNRGGIKVYHLNIGQPDIKTPPQVIEAVRNYDQSIIAYGNSEGMQELREALPDYYAKYGLKVDAEDILITTGGGSEALQFAFMTLCDPPYDEIIIPEPYYTNVSSFAHSAMVDLVPVTSNMDEEFSLPDISAFEKKISRKTGGAILLCSPNNPTGHVYTKDELLQLLNLCKKHDIFLIVDEVYREFCYDGKEFTSVLSFEEFSNRVICVDSFSKRYSMCGARIGALVSKNKEVLENALKLSQARLCPPDIEQVAALAALDTDDSYLRDVKIEYEKRRDFIVDALQKIDGGVKVSTPLRAPSTWWQNSLWMTQSPLLHSCFVISI